MSLESKINKLVTQFENNLWQAYNNRFLGRTFRVHNKDKKIQPHLYVDGREYNEVKYNDKYDSTIFFDVEPEETLLSTGYSEANVNIIVAVNLGKIYGNNTRAVESAHYDVLSIVQSSYFRNVNALVKGLEAYNDYDLTDDQNYRFNLQPVYLFKIETTIEYNVNTACTYIAPVVTEVQNVFFTTPVLKNGEWVFEDQSGYILTNPAKNIDLICRGNSITVGTICGQPDKYPELLETSLNAQDYTSTAFNKGEGGKTAAELLATHNTEVFPLRDTGKNQLFIFQEFANSVVTETAQQAYDDYKANVELAKSQGFITIALTATPSSDPVRNAKIQDANTLLRNDNSFSDYFFDMAAVTEYLDPLDTNYFCDGLHINDYQPWSDALSTFIQINVTLSDIPISNDVLISNNTAAKCFGDDTFIRYENAAAQSFDYIRFYIKTTTTAAQRPWGRNNNAGYGMQVNSTPGEFRIISQSVTSNTTSGSSFNDGLAHLIEIWNDGTDLIIHEDGVEILNQTGFNAAFNSSDNFFNIGNGGSTTIQQFEGEIWDLELKLSGATVLRDALNLQDGLKSYSLEGSAYEADILGTNAANVWDGRHNEEPTALTNGCTIFQNDSTQAFMFIEYFNGSPVSITPTGYTLVGEFPVGSGILRNMTSLYKRINYSDWRESNKTFDEIYDESESSIYVPTKTANSVSQLIINTIT